MLPQRIVEVHGPATRQKENMSYSQFGQAIHDVIGDAHIQFLIFTISTLTSKFLDNRLFPLNDPLDAVTQGLFQQSDAIDHFEDPARAK